MIRGSSTTRDGFGPARVFLAMQGETTDGNRYIGKAIEQGAAAIVTDSAAVFAETANNMRGSPSPRCPPEAAGARWRRSRRISSAIRRGNSR